MKILKGLFLSIVIFCFSVLLILIQINIAFDNTFLSSNYFSSSFDENNISTTLKDFAVYKIQNTNILPIDAKYPQSNNRNNNVMLDFNMSDLVHNYLDQDWLEEQLSLIVKGTHAYLVSDTTTLPIIDIQPIKESFFEGLVDELMKREEVKNSLTAMSKVFKLLDKVDASTISNNELVNRIMDLEIINDYGIDKDVVQNIITIYKENKDCEAADINKQIVSKIIKTKINYNGLQNEIDLNNVVNKIFKDIINPFETFRNLFKTNKTIILQTLIILCAILILIIFITCFKLYSSLNWISSGLVLSGLISILIGVIGSFFPLISNALYYNTIYKVSSIQEIESIVYIKDWIKAFIDKYFTTLIIQGAILIILAVIIFIVAKIISKTTSKKNTSNKTVGQALTDGNVAVASKTISLARKAFVLVVRTVAVFILIALISYVVTQKLDDFSTTINDCKASIEQVSDYIKNIDILEILKDIMIDEH